MTARATRRAVLAGLALAPAALVAGRAIAAAGAGARALRPSARGRSATTCGACGATGHSMLDPACPSAPRVI
ncbi:MAG TPA: hypothetical protein VF044_02730 [Actinomycetota bacterium]